MSRLLFVPAMGNGVLARKVPIIRLAFARALMMSEISVFSTGVGFFMSIAVKYAFCGMVTRLLMNPKLKSI